jgi:hypothetical protein
MPTEGDDAQAFVALAASRITPAATRAPSRSGAAIGQHVHKRKKRAQDPRPSLHGRLVNKF